MRRRWALNSAHSTTLVTLDDVVLLKEGEQVASSTIPEVVTTTAANRQLEDSATPAQWMTTEPAPSDDTTTPGTRLQLCAALCLWTLSAHV